MRIAPIAAVVCLSLAWTALLPAQTPPKKLKPPEEAEVAAAKKLVADVYRDEYVKAKTPEQKLALAQKLMGDAIKTSDDPASRYALLLVARDIAAGAGDWEASISAIEQLGQTFEIDPFDMADQARTKIEAADKPPRNAKNAFLLLVTLVDAAITKDRYDIAERLASSAQRVARKAGDTTFSRLLADRVLEMQKLKRQYEDIQADVAALEQDPVDPAANLAVGKFRCYVQHRWDAGVPLLALGSDKELAETAQKELVEPTEGGELVALGDAWWALADARKNEEKPLRRHAVDRYLRAAARAEGLSKKKVEARITEVEKWHSKDATYSVSGLHSKFDKEHPPLPTLLNGVDKFHKDGTEFAFCITHREAYIVIDLKREVAISRLHILNRSGNFERAQGMTVHISSSPQRGEEIWRAPDAAPEWNVTLPKLAVGRYLTIARDPQRGDAYFHLRKVKVYGPE